jgi:hypothetical protein
MELNINKENYEPKVLNPLNSDDHDYISFSASLANRKLLEFNQTYGAVTKARIHGMKSESGSDYVFEIIGEGLYDSMEGQDPVICMFEGRVNFLSKQIWITVFVPHQETINS